MTSKKQPSTKRSALPRTSDYTKTFFKDWERLTRSGRFDMNRLKGVMLLLIANDGPLGVEWSDHPLKGNKAAYRECHVGGDFLLMYCIEATSQGETIIFVRAGTHADLFDE
jgi:mRNA interferase YafQ